MLIVTQLTGHRFGLNPDLIQRVDAQHDDTVITLVDGTRYLVAESLDEVAEMMLDHRIAIVGGRSSETPHLRLVRPDRG
jgi:flagellar protein FlbD